MNIEALIFDCDGVLVDTERDGHRVAFNEAFSKLNIPVKWSVSEYKELVRIAGGKERMKAFFEKKGWPVDYPDREELIKQLHKIKTDLFMGLITSDRLQARPGILRIIDEAIEKKIPLAVCSTSNEKSVNLIVEHIIGKHRSRFFQAILAGDIVKKKKPDPEIYNLCKKKLNINPANSIVIEDSRNGLVAAKKAGFRCLITTNEYSSEENFDEAEKVVTELGDIPGRIIGISDLELLLKQ